MGAEPGRSFLKQSAAKLEPVIVASWRHFDLSRIQTVYSLRKLYTEQMFVSVRMQLHNHVE